jgi:hypothetical protein
MSCCSQTETGAAFAARQTSSLRSVFNRVVERFRVARNRRRQCRELIEYLASDHRAANDAAETRPRIAGENPPYAVKRQWSANGMARPCSYPVRHRVQPGPPPATLVKGAAHPTPPVQYPP